MHFYSATITTIPLDSKSTFSPRTIGIIGGTVISGFFKKYLCYSAKINNYQIW